MSRTTTDCLIIGFYDYNFEAYLDFVKSMGVDSGAYRDLNLAFVEHEGKPYRALDILSHFYFKGRSEPKGLFHHADFLWPAVAYLGSYLARRGMTFDYVNLPHLQEGKFIRKLTEGHVLTIAITTTVYILPQPIIEIIKLIRRYNAAAKIVVGGPFIANQNASQDPAAMQVLYKYMGADVYVNSIEGELALLNIIRACKTGHSLDSVDNIAYRRGSDYVVTRGSVEDNALQDNPVDYGLFPRDEIGQLVSLRTGKSCPFACAFCGYPVRAGRYQYLPVGCVERELNQIRDLECVTTLNFLDDTFNVPKERFKALLRMMIRNKYGFKWHSYFRVDHGDEETVELMHDSGCEGAFLGMESGSDEMCRRMNKHARQKDYARMIPLLREAGISTYASLIIGFPGETCQTVQETRQFIEAVKPEYFRAQLWYADPVTPVWRKREALRISGEGFSWAHETMDCDTACDLIDELFLSVQNSTWLPQWGFEQWSIFYLQRKGMPAGRIKEFIKCFDSIIKARLLNGNQPIDCPGLFQALERISRFDAPAGPGSYQEFYPASEYISAQEYWVSEVKSGLGRNVLEGLGGPGEKRPKEMETVVFLMKQPMPRAQSTLDPVRVDEMVLASFGVVIARLLNGEELTVLCRMAGDAQHAFPIRLYARSDLRFADYCRKLKHQIRRIADKRRYAFPLLSNPRRMREFDCASPAFNLACIFGTPDETQTQDEGSVFENLHCTVADEVRLILESSEHGQNLRMSWTFDGRWFRRETIEAIGLELRAFLEIGIAHPEMLLSEIGTEDVRSQSRPAAFAEEIESFCFNDRDNA